YPHMNHLGGDGVWVVHEPSGKVRALMAAGAAGARATLAHYREAGHDRIPTRGPLAALTAPAAVAGWTLALEAAKAQGGRLPLADLLAAAIKQARDGVEVSRHLALTIADASRELKDVPGFAETFLIGGKPPAQGARLRCVIGCSPIRRGCRIRSTAISHESSSMPRPPRSTAARPHPGRRTRRWATRSGWAPPTRPVWSSPTSSRSIGNSALAWCCRRPAS